MTRVFRITEAEISDLIERSVARGRAELAIGDDAAFDNDDELGADMRFLRRLRRGSENLTVKVGTTVVLGLVATVGSLLVLGLRAWLGK